MDYECSKQHTSALKQPIGESRKDGKDEKHEYCLYNFENTYVDTNCPVYRRLCDAGDLILVLQRGPKAGAGNISARKNTGCRMDTPLNRNPIM